MALDLTAGAAPIFMSKNYITIDADTAGDLIASTGQTLVHRLYGMDPTSQWSSSGSNDATTETLVIGLYTGGSQISQSIDFVALYNVNLKNFKIEYSNDNGATYTTVPGSDFTGSPFSGKDLVLNITPTTMNKIRVTMTTTQTANQDKKVGTIVLALSSFQAKSFQKYMPARKDNRVDVKLADGSLDYTYLLWSDGQFELYSAKIGWQNLQSADRLNLRSIATQTAPFLFYPEPGDLVEEIHQCAMVPNSYSEVYASEFKGSGWNITMEVQELGAS